jgi:hypothetical protein
VADPQDAKNERALRRLLRGLMRELFQTETSAVQHCRREAERLSEAPPARTLHEISSQAASFLKELPHVAAAHDLPKSAGGMMIGALFSEARDKVVDRLIRTERSYRGTLLGVRHGIDLVQLLAQTAHEAGYTELYLFCERWLAARQRLVASLEREMVWFAKQPAEAMRFAR